MGPANHPEPSWARLLALASALALAGCAGLPEQTGLMARTSKVTVSAPELRADLRDLASVLPGIVEESVDRVLAGTTDPDQRRAALVFKINAVSDLYQSLFRQDPLAALVDTWALVFQIQAALEGAGGSREDVREAAARMGERMQGEIERVVHEAAPKADIAAVRARVQAWAREHPTDRLLRVRASTEPLLASLTAGGERGGVLAAIGRLSQDVSDVLPRLDVYVEALPKISRWQAELLVEDTLAKPGLDRAMADLPRALDALDRILARLEAAEPLDAIDVQRIATLDFMRNERIAITEDIHAGRVATMQDLEAMSVRLGRTYEAEAERLVDHTILRMTEMIAALLVVAAAGLAVALRAGHRR